MKFSTRQQLSQLLKIIMLGNSLSQLYLQMPQMAPESFGTQSTCSTSYSNFDISHFVPSQTTKAQYCLGEARLISGMAFIKST